MFKRIKDIASSPSPSSLPSSSLLCKIIEYLSNNSSSSSSSSSSISIKGHLFDKNDINKQIIALLNTTIITISNTTSSSNISANHNTTSNTTTDHNTSSSSIYSYSTISMTPYIYLKRSSVSTDAGTGVFVSKKLHKGQCVSLYPGHYIPPKPHLISISLDGDVPPLVDTIVNHNIDDDSIIHSNAYSIHCSNHGGNVRINNNTITTTSTTTTTTTTITATATATATTITTTTTTATTTTTTTNTNTDTNTNTNTTTRNTRRLVWPVIIIIISSFS